MPERIAQRLEALPSQSIGQLQALYDGAPVGLAFIDTDLRYLSINDRLAEINGRPVDAHLGPTVVDLCPEIFRAIEPQLRRVLAGDMRPRKVFLYPRY